LNNVLPLSAPKEYPLFLVVTGLVVLVVSLIVLGPLAASLSLYGYIYFKRSDGLRRRRLMLVGLVSLLWVGLVGFSLLSQSREITTAILEQPFRTQEVLKVWMSGWLVTLPAVPGSIVGWLMFEWLADLLKPKTLEEEIKRERERLAAREAAASQWAIREEADVPEALEGIIWLGPYISGDYFPKGTGVTRRGTWLALDNALLNQHLFILGATGAGKSETIKRIVYEVVRSSERDVYLVDGKGEEELSYEVRAILYGKRDQVPVFRLGQDLPGARYHGFRGSKTAIYSRLVSMVGVTEAEGPSAYYADINRNILQLICNAPAGPPRSFQEVEERLDLDWFKATYQRMPRLLRRVERLDEEKLNSLRVRLEPLVSEFEEVVDPDGFILEETRGAIFSIRTQSMGDTSKRFLKFLVEDLKDFCGKRQTRPGLLIIDEFGTFGNDNIIALLQLARSQQLGVILATQDVSTLGDPLTARLILSNTRTKILMATDYPEEIAMLAGTIKQIEASMQHNEGEATGMGSAREQDAFRVPMNDVARLLPGEAFVIRSRSAAKVRVSQVTNVPDVPSEVLPEREVNSFESDSPDDKSAPNVIDLF
jgi:Cdc6-like AAA superfamily ATPase